MSTNCYKDHFSFFILDFITRIIDCLQKTYYVSYPVTKEFRWKSFSFPPNSTLQTAGLCAREHLHIIRGLLYSRCLKFEEVSNI